ncbi:MAG: hypothetical protein ACQESP_08920 [Candidatus Muiribacteriota bacterium]
MFKNFFYFIFFLILLLFIIGCSDEEVNTPIQYPDKKISVKPEFESPMESYFSNQSIELVSDTDKNQMEVTLNNISAFIQSNQFQKAIELIEDEQRAESNPYNQLVYHQLKAYCLKKLNQRQSYGQEVKNFLSLYERLISSY